MSEIQNIINNKDSILVFDVDGVLAKLEFGKYNHFMDDIEWENAYKNGINCYDESKVIKKMQDFIRTRNMDNVYVATVVTCGDNEGMNKVAYLIKYYGIHKENIYYVPNNKDKLEVLLKIKEKYPELSPRNIVLIDDTVEILNDVMNNSEFITAHISSFLDLEINTGRQRKKSMI